MGLEQKAGITLIILGLAGLLVSLWPGPVVSQEAPQPEPSPPLASCRVLFVTDGDTVACDLNGNGRYDKPRELVRFLGIDTPEMHYSKKNPSYGTERPTDEPFAKEASALTEQMTKGQTLYLEYDIHRTDARGRTLAYVYAPPEKSLDVKNLDIKTMHSPAEALLKQGYAEVLFFKPNLRHYDRYQALEDEAHAKRLGIWSRQ